MANLWPPMAPMAVVIVALAAGCHAGGVATVTTRVRVAAGPFALAQVAQRVGVDRVVVDRAGAPATAGAVVLDTGGDPDPWLDPVAMQQVTQRAADTLSGADPPGRAVYQAAARAYRAQLGALDIDYRSSLADCARHDVVTADLALARTGARYGFTDHAASDSGIEQLMVARGIPVVFTEAGVDPAPVTALARATHARVDSLDTLTSITPDEQARGASYLSLMTDNLAQLRSALGCSSGP